MSLLYSCHRVYLETFKMPSSLNAIDIWSETLAPHKLLRPLNYRIEKFQQSGIFSIPKVHFYTNALHFFDKNTSIPRLSSFGGPRQLNITICHRLPMGGLPDFKFVNLFSHDLFRLDPWKGFFKRLTNLQEFLLEIETRLPLSKKNN